MNDKSVGSKGSLKRTIKCLLRLCSRKASPKIGALTFGVALATSMMLSLEYSIAATSGNFVMCFPS
jgi:hypothetical protein